MTEEFEHELTPAEVVELEKLRARHAKARAVAEPKPAVTPNAVSVLIPRSAFEANAPFVLDVRIDHN